MRLKKNQTKNLVESLFALVVKVLAALSVLIINAVLVRVLSVEQMGKYVTLNALILFWIMLSACGLPLVLMRWISMEKVKGESAGVVKNTVLAVFCLALMGWVTSWVYFLVQPEKLTSAGVASLLPSVCGWVVLGLVLRTIGELFRGLGRIRWANLLTAVNSHGVLATLFVAGILWWGQGSSTQDVAEIIRVQVLVLGLLVMGAGLVLIRDIAVLEPKQPVPGKRKNFLDQAAFKAGLVLAIIELCVYVMTQGDVWFVQQFGSATDAALYGVAAKMAFLTSLVLIAVNSALPPLVAKYALNKNDIALERDVRQLVKFAAVGAFLWLAICSCFGGEVLGLAFGLEYAEAKYYLLILSMGHLVSVLTGPCAVILIMYKKETEMLKGTLGVFLLYIITTQAVGRYFGSSGIAICSAVGFAGVNLVYAYQVKRLLGIDSGLLRF